MSLSLHLHLPHWPTAKEGHSSYARRRSPSLPPRLAVLKNQTKWWCDWPTPACILYLLWRCPVFVLSGEPCIFCCMSLGEAWTSEISHGVLRSSLLKINFLHLFLHIWHAGLESRNEGCSLTSPLSECFGGNDALSRTAQGPSPFDSCIRSRGSLLAVCG